MIRSMIVLKFSEKYISKEKEHVHGCNRGDKGTAFD